MLSLGSAQAFAGKIDAVGVMDETVQDGVGIGGIADDFGSWDVIIVERRT